MLRAILENESRAIHAIAKMFQVRRTKIREEKIQEEAGAAPVTLTGKRRPASYSPVPSRHL